MTMSKERFKLTSYKMSYKEYKLCDCVECKRKNCIHRDAYRRLPRVDGGLGLCLNLKNREDFKQ